MNAEKIIEEILKKSAEARQTLNEVDKLVKELETANTEDWDWVSVRKAADAFGVSVSLIYRKIDSGQITARHFESKKLVRLSELEKINDVEIA